MDAVRRIANKLPPPWQRGGYRRLSNPPPLDPGDKDSKGVSVFPRRLFRLSNQGLVLLVAAFVLVPALLTLAVFNGQSYVSDGVEDVVSVGKILPPADFVDVGGISPPVDRIDGVHSDSPDQDPPSLSIDQSRPNASNGAVYEDQNKVTSTDISDEDQDIVKSTEEIHHGNHSQLHATNSTSHENQTTVDSDDPASSVNPYTVQDNGPSYGKLRLEDTDEKPKKKPAKGKSGKGKSKMAKVPEPAAGDHRLVILLPADNSGPSVCKVALSGMALGYPSPVIINWSEGGAKTLRPKLRSHLTKITGTMEYLDHMMRLDTHAGDRLREHDLVVLVDAYDVWWQLPPDVLIKRYHETNRLANERLAKEWGAEGTMPMRQTIVASVQKKCWPTPEMPGDRHCKALPESSARKDLYGEFTDVPPALREKMKNKHHDIRPKYFNSGTIMGPAGDLRRYLRRVQERMDKTLAFHPKLWSDQAIFGEIFGEQEVWRTWLREQHDKKGPFIENSAIKMVRDQFEYHVGLDYSQQLFIPTVFEEWDGDMIRLNNKTLIAEKSKELGISPVRLKGVPDDIKASENPLKKVVSQDKKASLSWGDMPLYADFFSEAIPVAVHHNAHAGGIKLRREWWWNRTWYFPYLRELAMLHLEKPAELKPLGNYSTKLGDAVYWPPGSDRHKRKPRVFVADLVKTGLPELEFEVLCRSKGEDDKTEERWYSEVFRDGKGGL
ncbi:hypothetical protein QQX98_001034 [Neonectria punicea]|uniref:Uncharacterized protein n=1 Tax=Neonectria punicea TaxID=979145 RepID=A0ABR1HRC8_9HYPO